MNSASQLNEYCMKNNLSIEHHFVPVSAEQESYWHCKIEAGQCKKSAKGYTKKAAYEDACKKVILHFLQHPVKQEPSLSDVMSRIDQLEKKINLLLS